MIMIIGSKGSMGKRYKAICDFLGHSTVEIDLHNEHTIDDQLMFCDFVIIATPTETHFKFLEKLIPTGKKILVEKPITKSLVELQIIGEMAHQYKNPITMMMQYRYLSDNKTNGQTYYDYFRTGNDGLYWDCLQIIGLAKSEWYISNTSPIWICKINGIPLSLSDMDSAYVKFVRDWIDGTQEIIPFSEYYNIHLKVHNAIHRA